MSDFILSLDTTHEFGSLALLEDGVVAGETLLHAPEGFGPVLYGHIARLLERNGRRVTEIACFAAAAGPGSFTGVRVGLACVKGLAEAAGKPMAPVSNLEALASCGTAPVRAAILDARRGEVYAAVFGEVIRPEVVTRFGPWLESLPDVEMEFVSPDFEPFRPALSGTRFAGSKITTSPRALAAAVGRIAWQRWREGLAVDPAAVDANYVRRPDAELFRR